MIPASADDRSGYIWSAVGEIASVGRLEFQVTGNGNDPSNSTSGCALACVLATRISNNSLIVFNDVYFGKSDLLNWQVSAASAGRAQQIFERGSEQALPPLWAMLAE